MREPCPRPLARFPSTPSFRPFFEVYEGLSIPGRVRAGRPDSREVSFTWLLDWLHTGARPNGDGEIRRSRDAKSGHQVGAWRNSKRIRAFRCFESSKRASTRTC